MNIPYSFNIIKTDEAARSMEVVYSSPGRKTMHVGARLPYAGESRDAVIHMFAPIQYWIEQEAAVVVPELGGGEFVPAASPDDAPETLEIAKARKLAALAEWRYEQEVAGIYVGGANIKTDRESQATITSAFVSLSQGLGTSIDWKAQDRVWIQLGIDQVRPIAQAVFSHVQSCFTAEKDLAAEIDALTTIGDVLAFQFPDMVA